MSCKDHFFDDTSLLFLTVPQGTLFKKTPRFIKKLTLFAIKPGLQSCSKAPHQIQTKYQNKQDRINYTKVEIKQRHKAQEHQFKVKQRQVKIRSAASDQDNPITNRKNKQQPPERGKYPLDEARDIPSPTCFPIQIPRSNANVNGRKHSED